MSVASPKPPFFDLADPRAETPEPSSVQGRRNAGVQLLDDEGQISEQLETCLRHIFAKYCTPRIHSSSADRPFDYSPSDFDQAYLTQDGLDTWAKDTNGSVFSQETKDELIDFLDVTDKGELTFKGFVQIYQLQTENDEEETWRDLALLSDSYAVDYQQTALVQSAAPGRQTRPYVRHYGHFNESEVMTNE